MYLFSPFSIFKLKYFLSEMQFFPKPSLIYQIYTTLISMRLRLYGDALLLCEYDKCEM